jgi:serine/threonine protein phosphatase PrpC
MPPLEIAKAVEACGTVLEDRAEVFKHGASLILVVADGAGGTAGGAEAAEAVVRAVGNASAGVASLHDPEFWRQLLSERDGALADDSEAGETTAVAAAVSSDGITGVSVGDSGAWLITPGGYDELTISQHRKPRLGTGEAIPVPFSMRPWHGTLLLASDGLFKYATDEKICEVARESDLQMAALHFLDPAPAALRPSTR